MTDDLSHSVRTAVFWRSGSQILAQIVTWVSTLIVIRILNPADYGLFAMTQVVFAFLGFLSGYGFASSLVREKELTPMLVRQGFGLLLLVNGGLALTQFLIAPVAAAYFRQPQLADLLRVQSVIYLSTPFIALPEAVLVRNMDFRRPAIANLIATAVMVVVALGCAFAGLGVWTLVWAPLVAFWTRGLMLVLISRFFVMPSFRFSGAGGMLNFGLLLLGSHFFWTVMTQADVLIAGRRMSAHDLGLYSEALFLTMIFAAKFVPPLNEVAFPAYARMQEDRSLLAASFLKAVRMILLVATPIYFGLAATARPAVAVLFGDKWLEMAPLVAIIGFSMPAYTLHVLFTPALNAVGRPGLNAVASAFGAGVMIIAFLFGSRFGPTGLATAWLAAFPIVPVFTFLVARGPLGITAGGLVRAVAPALLASAAMAALVHVLGLGLSHAPAWAALPAQVAFGALSYGAILWIFSRQTLEELYGLVVRRRPPQPLADPSSEPSAT